MYRRLGLLELFHKTLLELVEKLIDLGPLHRISQQIVKLNQLREKEKGQSNSKNTQKDSGNCLGGNSLAGGGICIPGHESQDNAACAADQARRIIASD